MDLNDRKITNRPPSPVILLNNAMSFLLNYWGTIAYTSKNSRLKSFYIFMLYRLKFKCYCYYLPLQY